MLFYCFSLPPWHLVAYVKISVISCYLDVRIVQDLHHLKDCSFSWPDCAFYLFLSTWPIAMHIVFAHLIKKDIHPEYC